MRAHYSAKVPPTKAWQEWAKRWTRRKMAAWLDERSPEELLAMALMESIIYCEYHEFTHGTHCYVSVASAS